MIFVKIGPELHNCVKRGFLGKTDQCQHFNLSFPIMLKCFKITSVTDHEI